MYKCQSYQSLMESLLTHTYCNLLLALPCRACLACSSVPCSALLGVLSFGALGGAEKAAVLHNGRKSFKKLSDHELTYSN